MHGLDEFFCITRPRGTLFVVEERVHIAAVGQKPSGTLGDLGAIGGRVIRHAEADVNERRSDHFGNSQFLGLGQTQRGVVFFEEFVEDDSLLLPAWPAGLAAVSRVGAAFYFFNPAAQLTTTVNGVGRPVSGGAINRKRLPSGDRSQPPKSNGGGMANMSRGAPAWNPLLVSTSTAINAALVA